MGDADVAAALCRRDWNTPRQSEAATRSDGLGSGDIFSLTPIFRPVSRHRTCHIHLIASLNNPNSRIKAVETAAARRRRNVTWLKPGVNELLFLYLVKINLIPAITSTVARQTEIARTGKRLLPR